MTEKLDDRWHSRDFPVLIAAARRLEAGRGAFMSHELVQDLQLSHEDIGQALRAVAPVYLLGKAEGGLASTPDFVVTGLTERGRRAAGLWPDEEQAADALIELLTRAADHVEDEDDAGALKKAGRLLRTVPAAVLADVTAALIRQQTGIG